MISEDDLIDDPQLGKYYSLVRGKNFHHVERLELCQADECGSHTASINLELSSLTEEPRHLYLAFRGVVDLLLTPPIGWGISFLSSLEIFPVRGSQGAGAKYKVKETEDDMISFFCRDFTADIR